MILTRCGANVGTYDMRTLLRELARLTSQPDNENFIFYGLISKISMWSFSIAAPDIMIQNIIKSPITKIDGFYILPEALFKIKQTKQYTTRSIYYILDWFLFIALWSFLLFLSKRPNVYAAAIVLKSYLAV